MFSLFPLLPDISLLISTEVCSDIWIVKDNTVTIHDGDFDDYRSELIEEFEEREREEEEKRKQKEEERRKKREEDMKEKQRKKDALLNPNNNNNSTTSVITQQ